MEFYFINGNKQIFIGDYVVKALGNAHEGDINKAQQVKINMPRGAAQK